MDTLYLVFKHHSKLSLDCLTDGIISPQANEDFNPVTSPCQATRRKTLGFLFEMQKCRPARNLHWQGDTFMCPWIPSISNFERKLYYIKTQLPNSPFQNWLDPDKTCEPVFPMGSLRRAFAHRRLSANHAADDDFISPTRAKRSGNSRRENMRDLLFPVAKPAFNRNALTDSLADAPASPEM